MIKIAQKKKNNKIFRNRIGIYKTFGTHVQNVFNIKTILRVIDVQSFFSVV